MKRKNSLTALLLLLFAVLLAQTGFSQSKKSDTIGIKSSAVCDMCKERIEGCFAFEKGVKSAVLDLETKEVTIVYNPSKTSPAVLRKTMSKLGYDADSVAADPVAYAKLPACCKKDAPKH